MPQNQILIPNDFPFWRRKNRTILLAEKMKFPVGIGTSEMRQTMSAMPFGGGV